MEQWRGLVSAYGWPVDEALAVLSCESGGDVLAYNGGSMGLFQVHYPSHSGRVSGPEALYDPATNIAVAYDIWIDNAGWGPWGCKP